MSNQRHNSCEYGTNQPPRATTHTQYPNTIAEEEIDDNDHYRASQESNYTYVPVETHHSEGNSHTFTYDGPSTPGYAAHGQQGRSTDYHEPAAYRQPRYQQQESFHQSSDHEHRPTEQQHQPPYQQQSVYVQYAADQQQYPVYQPFTYEHQLAGTEQPTGHNNPTRHGESPSTRRTETDMYTSPSRIDSSTGGLVHSVTPTPRTWTGSSLEVNIPESVHGCEEFAPTTTSEMTSSGSGSHECYPPSPESYACDDPALAATTTQAGECDIDRIGDFVADRQLSFERHQQYGYAPVRASIRRVADRRRDIRQVEVAQARAVRKEKSDRGQKSGDSGKQTGSK